MNYSAFLSCLRTRPELVAQWIVIGESLIDDQKAFSSILHSVVTGLYGSLLLPQDVRLMMTLLQCLAKLQLVTTDNPRRYVLWVAYIDFCVFVVAYSFCYIITLGY